MTTVIGFSLRSKRQGVKGYNQGTMAPAIKVDRPFATVQDTAKTLGVPKSRTDELIRRVKDLTDRIMHRSGDTDEDEDESREDPSRAESTTTAGEKKGKHHADKHARKAREKKEKEARERR